MPRTTKSDMICYMMCLLWLFIMIFNFSIFVYAVHDLLMQGLAVNSKSMLRIEQAPLALTRTNVSNTGHPKLVVSPDDLTAVLEATNALGCAKGCPFHDSIIEYALYNAADFGTLVNISFVRLAHSEQTAKFVLDFVEGYIDVMYLGFTNDVGWISIKHINELNSVDIASTLVTKAWKSINHIQTLSTNMVALLSELYQFNQLGNLVKASKQFVDDHKCNNIECQKNIDEIAAFVHNRGEAGYRVLANLYMWTNQVQVLEGDLMELARYLDHMSDSACLTCESLLAGSDKANLCPRRPLPLFKCPSVKQIAELVTKINKHLAAAVKNV